MIYDEQYQVRPEYRQLEIEPNFIEMSLTLRQQEAIDRAAYAEQQRQAEADQQRQANENGTGDVNVQLTGHADVH